MADEAPAKPVGREIFFAAMQDMAAKEDNIARVGRDENLVVPVGNLAKHVFGVVGVGDASDVGDVADEFVAEAVASLGAGWVDGLDAATLGEPHGAVEFVASIDADPGAAECVRVRGQVIRILVPALAGFAGRFEEEHRLQSKHVGAEDDFKDIEHARMEHVAFVEFEFAVEHVDAEEVLRFLGWREMSRRCFETLNGYTVIFVEVALGHLFFLLREPALHEVFRVLPQFGNFGRQDKVADDEKTIMTKASVFIHRNKVAILAQAHSGGNTSSFMIAIK